MGDRLAEDIERIALAIRILDAELHRLAPYSPTPPQLAPQVAEAVKNLLASMAKRQPVVTEAGCGKGQMARTLSAATNAYTICIEIDENLASTIEATHLVEPIVSDIHHPPIRRTDLVYAYLLPHGVQVALENINTQVLVSLDYKAEKTEPDKTIMLQGYRELHIYLKTRPLNNTPKIRSTTNNTGKPTIRQSTLQLQ